MPTRRIRRNIAWKTLGLVVEKGLRLVLVAMIARTLGTEVYGQYTYAAAVALLCVQITDLGLGLFLAREIARSEMPPPRLIGEVLAVKAVLAGLYLVVLAGLTWWHFVDPLAGKAIVPRHHASALAFTIGLTGLSSLATSAIEAIWQVFRGIQRLELEARSGSFFAGCQLVCAFGALEAMRHIDPSGTDRPLIMVAIALGMVVAGGLGLYQTIRLLITVVTPQFGWSREMLSRFRREVLPLGVAIVASLIYFKIDVPMLRALTRDDGEVGVYSAAYKLLENAAVVPSVLLAATFPALSQTVISNPREAVRLHKRTLLVLLGTGALGSLVLLLAPGILIRLIFGAKFAASIPVLRALAPSVVLTFVNYLETHMLVALGLVKRQMAFALALVLVNVMANLAFMPQWGGVGAAWSTALTEVVLLAFCAPLVHRTLKERLAQPPVEAT